VISFYKQAQLFYNDSRTEIILGRRDLSYYVRMMGKEDITQVTEIDREAFPTLWPPTNYQRELENRLARYIVACDEVKVVEVPEVKAASERVISGLVSRVRQILNRDRYSNNELPPSVTQYLMGFAGFWMVADEAHITNIAVREIHRLQGIGELLLISVIDLATELKAGIVTLEVRVSNNAAQKLYYKYGFTQVGLRRGYYIDDKEDAVLMSAENIASASYQAHLRQLKQSHSRKWGIPLYQIVR